MDIDSFKEFFNIAEAPGTKKKEFRYQPLESQRDTIRLVSIDSEKITGSLKCYLVHVRLSKLQTSPAGNRYCAISYQWGSPEDTRQILVNGRTLTIRRNLFEFLTAWKNTHIGQSTSWLWVDAICLDQDNEAEMSRQVQRMGEIFRSADRVIAWLGYGSHTVENALKTTGQGSTLSSKEERLEEMRAAYHLISRLSYWQRLWIVQELILANEAKLMYKSTRIDWDQFGEGLAKYCVEKGRDAVKEEDEAVLTALGAEIYDNPYFRGAHDYESEKSIPWRMRDRRKIFQIYGHWKLWTPRNMPALVDLLFSFEDSKCYRWRDRIYGCLGLVQGGEKFFVDYNESREDLKKRVIETFATTEDAKKAHSGGERRLKIALDRVFPS